MTKFHEAAVAVAEVIAAGDVLLSDPATPEEKKPNIEASMLAEVIVIAARSGFTTTELIDAAAALVDAA